MPKRDHKERAARIICRRAGAPLDKWPMVADSFTVAHLALALATRDFVRAAIRATPFA